MARVKPKHQMVLFLLYMCALDKFWEVNCIMILKSDLGLVRLCRGVQRYEITAPDSFNPLFSCCSLPGCTVTWPLLQDHSISIITDTGLIVFLFSIDLSVQCRTCHPIDRVLMSLVIMYQNNEEKKKTPICSVWIRLITASDKRTHDCSSWLSVYMANRCMEIYVLCWSIYLPPFAICHYATHWFCNGQCPKLALKKWCDDEGLTLFNNVITTMLMTLFLLGERYFLGNIKS